MNTLSKSLYKSFIPLNTNDLINSLLITINSTSKDFDYANAFIILPQIVEKTYECLDQKPIFSLEPLTTPPTETSIKLLDISKQLLVVSSIGLNKNHEKTHIHLWTYGLHFFNKDYQRFYFDLSKSIKKLKGISKKNEFSIKFSPVFDNLDEKIRQSNNPEKTICDYICNREFNTLMNYLSSKNDPNFLYFY